MAKSFISFLTLTVLVAAASAGSKDCKTYSVKSFTCKQEGSEDLFKLTVNSAKIIPECKVLVDGCLEVKKEVKDCMVDYKLSKSGMPAISGKDKLSVLMEKGEKNQEMKNAFEMFGFPTSCPVKENKICNSEKMLDLSKDSSKMMGAIGKSQVVVKLTCDEEKPVTFTCEADIDKKFM